MHVDLILVQAKARSLRDHVLSHGLDTAGLASIWAEACRVAKLVALEASLLVNIWLRAVSGTVVAMAIAALSRLLRIAAGAPALAVARRLLARTLAFALALLEQATDPMR